MADKPGGDGQGISRARGRATGRGLPRPQSGQQTPMVPGASGGGGGDPPGSESRQGSGSGSGNGSGSGSRSGSTSPGSESDIRGRAGYRVRPNADEMKTRPDNATSGSIGSKIGLFANYFELLTPSSLTVHSYHVEFEPAVEVVRMRRQLIYGLAGEMFNSALVFDGTANIKALNLLAEDPTVKFVQNPIAGTPDAQVKITFKYTGEIGWGSLEMMRMYNTQMRRNFQHLKFSLMGRNYFDAAAKVKLTQFNVFVMPGYVTAINQHEHDILMVVDFTTKFVRGEKVINILGDLQKRSQFIEEARRQLAGSIVMTTYNNRTYRIDDILFDAQSTPATFTFTSGDRTISLVDYYKEKWNKVITNPGSPLISCMPTARDRRAGRTDPIILVPEFCLLTGLTDAMRADYNFMNAIGEYSKLNPFDRCKKLIQFINRVSGNEKVVEEIGKWQYTYKKDLLELEGRILPAENIFMRAPATAPYQQNSGDFSREIRSKAFISTPSLRVWYIFVNQRDRQQVDEFVNTMIRVAGPMGMNMNRPNIVVLQNDSASAFVEACKKLQQDCDIVVCIVGNNNKDRYDAIKKVCYIDNPMPCQVVVSRTISKPKMLMSVCTKIAIQISCKLGGEPWGVLIPPKDCMLVGFDTYHDSSRRGESVGAFVSSSNPTLTSWYSRVSYHKTQEEMSSNFAENLKEGIRQYHKRNGRMPKRVLVYRDGVSEGMIPHVYDVEVMQLLDVIKSLGTQDSMFLSFTIVTKRINTRFFRKGPPPNIKRVDNPFPGTVVDTVVTRPNRWDFYLVSQASKQGTVSPTHYNIIYDGNNWKADNHQQLAYKLTHLYYNWPGTISVPAPCAYAHKLAYMVGTHLHRVPNVVLADRLFYL